MSNSTSIRENIAAIRAQIDAAARETGRTGAAITLVGASKMNGAAACQEAIAAGIDALGENRVQEMTAKLAEDAYRGAPLHFIGHLQRNKVKQVVGKAALIQSIGSAELLAEVDRQAEKLGIVQDILLEVIIGGEEASHYTITYNLPKIIAAPTKECQIVGRLLLNYDGQPVGSVDLAAEKVDAGMSAGSLFVRVFGWLLPTL